MMSNFDNITLPSDRKFGFFFTFVFLIALIYFYFKETYIPFHILVLFFIVFFLLTIFKPDILRPLNRLWMSFGFVLGIIIGPLIMGVIFFVIFTPIGILMKLFSRDELRLQFKSKSTYWIKRNEETHSNSFVKQF